MGGRVTGLESNRPLDCLFSLRKLLQARVSNGQFIENDFVVGIETRGFQVLEQLKTYRDTADIPVMMISARSRPRDREDALFMGAVDYITKPWSEGELELRVSWALTQNKSESGVTGKIDTSELAAVLA